MRPLISSVLFFALLATTPAWGNTALSMACMNAAALAERNFSLPARLLQAIAIVESGHARNGVIGAWPWTVNVDGTGYYFTSESDALAFVEEKNRLGNSSIDVGCFQINTKWHGENFSSVTKMFDPEVAAQYAASFLLKLYDEFGNWDGAVKGYHSRVEQKGDRYKAKVSSVRSHLKEAAGQEEDPMVTTASNLNMNSGNSQRPGSVEMVVLGSASPLIDYSRSKPFILEHN